MHNAHTVLIAYMNLVLFHNVVSFYGIIKCIYKKRPHRETAGGTHILIPHLFLNTFLPAVFLTHPSHIPVFFNTAPKYITRYTDLTQPITAFFNNT